MYLVAFAMEMREKTNTVKAKKNNKERVCLGKSVFKP